MSDDDYDDDDDGGGGGGGDDDDDKNVLPGSSVPRSPGCSVRPDPRLDRW